jgi:hypothetical protein
MTTRSRIRSQLEFGLRSLTRLELALATRPIVFVYSGDMVGVTWARSEDPPPDMSPFQLPLASVAQYIGFLSAGEYNCVLQDGAIIQASYDVEGETIVGHRLCYYPCPFDLTGWDVQSAGDVLEAVEMLTDTVAKGDDSQLGLVRLNGPVRFDYDAVGGVCLHDCSHLHLANPECRIPVFGPVSAAQFFRFVLRSFYPAAWLADEDVQTWSGDHLGRSLPDETKADMFVECLNQL